MKPSASCYERLMEEMEKMEIIDSHEHLPPEKERLAQNPDFSLFFSNYCMSDLQAAGMSATDVGVFLGKGSPDEKWRLLSPFYSLIQDGSYCRAAHLAMNKFYGIARLKDAADAQALTDAIRRENKPGLYRRILKDTCHIRKAMNFVGLDDDPEFFASVPHCTYYAEAAKQTIQSLEDQQGVTCGTLTAYVDAVREDLRRALKRGLKGIKFHFAYFRNLDFAPQSQAEAERVFLRVLEEGYGWRQNSQGYEEMRPLQNYMVHRLIEMAIDLDIPVVFHTGLQAQVRHNPDDARPLRLWNLPHRYRTARFILLHSGMPWMEEAALLAKQYPNVWLDMAWAHLISPVLSRQAISAWIDLLPMNKIFGFGGDFHVVEKVYGHLVLARENLAAVLADKESRGDITPARSRAWMQALLFDNPNTVYKLGLEPS